MSNVHHFTGTMFERRTTQTASYHSSTSQGVLTERNVSFTQDITRPYSKENTQSM